MSGHIRRKYESKLIRCENGMKLTSRTRKQGRERQPLDEDAVTPGHHVELQVEWRLLFVVCADWMLD